MAIIKIKLADGTDKYINDTEYVGICSVGVLNAKCVAKNFDDSFLIRGIAKLWSTKGFASESAILETQSAKLKGKSNTKYFHLLLHTWFQICNRSLESGLRPVFRREIEIRNSLRGKPDFYKTDSLNKGMLGSIVSVVSRLGLNMPEIMVIRDAYEYSLQNDDLLPADATMRAAMITTLSRGLTILAGVPKSDNVRKNASSVFQRLTSKKTSDSSHDLARLPPKLRHLSQTSAFCAKLLLNRNDGVVESEVGYSGLLLNMNYLLQRFLQNTCAYFAGPAHSCILSNGINYVENGISMQPDIVGALPDGDHFILDAKHKIFVNENSNDSTTKKQNQKKIVNSDGSSPMISREDFHQIISYSTTHHEIEKNTFYGLIGLWNAKDPLTSAYIDERSAPSLINFKTVIGGSRVIVISRLAINFARVLHEVGSNVQLSSIYESVFNEVFQKLKNDLEHKRNHDSYKHVG
jgi:hypothetical protein